MKELILIALIFVGLGAKAQKSAIDLCDQFYAALSEKKPVLTPYFDPAAKVSSVIYNASGESEQRSFDPLGFEREMEKLNSNFTSKQQPVVLVFREYDHLASIYMSVWTSLTDAEEDTTYLIRSVQSMRLVNTSGEWKIIHLVVQNEHPSYPIDEKLFPPKVTEPLLAQTLPPLLSDYDTEYDPNKVYRVDEVDEPPVYPGQPEEFQKLLSQFDVVTEPQVGFTPFIVTIMEDGSAELSYTHDLSGYQISRAESFVRSMLVWYPAINYAASVKCKLIFYIRA